MKRKALTVILLFWSFLVFALSGPCLAETTVWGPKKIPVKPWRLTHRTHWYKAKETEGDFSLRLQAEKAGNLLGFISFNRTSHFIWRHFQAGESMEWQVEPEKKNRIKLYVFTTKRNQLLLSVVRKGEEVRQTFIRGMVFDSDEIPLEGVTVTIGSLQVKTDEEGRYALPMNDTGMYLLDIYKPGYTYAVREAKVLSGHDTAVAPAYLLALDSKTTPVGTEGGTASNSTGEVEVVIPPGALDETIQVNLTPYRTDKTLPAPLPPSSIFTHCVSLEPHGTVFNEPVILRVKNDLGFAPGTLIPNGSLNRETGFWEHESTGRVTDDGQWIEAEIYGFSCRDINGSGYFGNFGPAPSKAEDSTLDKENCNPNSKHKGSLITYRTGELEEWVDIPLVKSGGLGQNLRLNYFNTSAHPVGMVEINGQFNHTPGAIGYKLKLEGGWYEGYFEGSSDPYRLAFAVEGKDTEGNNLPTGLYPYEAEVSSYGTITYGSGGVFGWVPDEDTGIPTREMVPKEQFKFKGEFRIYNRTQSPFGAGWGLSDEERIIKDQNSENLLLISGSGRSSRYRKQSTEDILVSLVAATEKRSIGIFVDENGVIYYCDTWARKVKKIENGTTTVLAQLPYLPNGIFVRDGVVYVTATWRIYRIDPGGQVTPIVSSTHDPCGIFVDPDGTLYYAETYTGKIWKKSPGSNPVMIAQRLATPEFIFKKDDYVYVTERLGRRIGRLDLTTGEITYVGVGAINAETGEPFSLVAPSGIFVDEDDSIYVADSGGQKIIMISADESRYSVLAGTGGKGFTEQTVPGDVATFNFPEGIWKHENEIFVADLFNQKIRKIIIPEPQEPGGDILYVSPSGNYSTLVKKEDGTYLRTLSDGTKLTYDENGYLTQSLSLNGRSLTYTYDDNGRLISRENSFGLETNFIYGSDGKLEIIRDRAGRETRLAIDESGDLASITRPDGSRLFFEYDEEHLLTRRTDERGYWKLYAYDENGMVIGTEDVMGMKESLSHSGLVNLIAENTIPADQATLLPFPGVVNENTVTDQRGRQWTKTTDERGYVTRSIDPLGRVTSYEIGCDCGAPTKITYPNGAVYQFTYDDKGRLVSQTDPYNATRTYTYDEATSRLTSVTNAKGNKTTFAYDGLGNLLSITDALGNVTSIVYNDRSLPSKLSDALANRAQLTYNSSGLISSYTDPLGYTTNFNYDQAGNLNRVTDGLGRATNYTYDPVGRLLTTTDARGVTTTFSYTPGGDLATVTDGSGNQTVFAYDLQGRPLQETDPTGKVKAYSYDEVGNLLASTNRRGQTIQYDYDLADRLIQKITPEQTIDYAYSPVDQLTRIGTIFFDYDLAGRMTYYRDSSIYFNFKYDAVGNLIEVRRAGYQLLYTHAYDALNRLTETTSGSKQFQFTYDALGRRTSLTYPNNMVARYSYNGRGELLSLAYEKDGQSVASYAYEYDAVGKRTTLEDSYGRQEFSYDAVNQLKVARWEDMGDERFGYDASGNILYNREYDFIYGVANRLVGDDCSRVSFTYDEDGNLSSKTTQEGTTQYSWDSENRLVAITKPDGTVVSYKYDELGRGVQKNVGSQQWRWIYLGEDIYREYTPSSSNHYVHGPGIDEPLSHEGRGYFLADGLGSITRIVGDSGNTLNEYRYTAFGKMAKAEESISNPYTYTGREWDAEAGLYYYRARWYDPEAGRFLSEDPIGFIGGDVNLYAYASNNPIFFVDPLGLCIDGERLYRVEMAGVGGGLGGYLEGGTFTLYDDIRKKAFDYRYFAFGGGWVIGVSAQPEVGLAYGSTNPQDWTGWGNAFNYEGIAPTFAGGGGQVAWSGSNAMYTSGPHAGTPGASGVYVSTYTWYIGARDIR